MSLWAGIWHGTSGWCHITTPPNTHVVLNRAHLTEGAVEKTPPTALKDTPMTVGVVSKKAYLTTSDVVQRTVPPQPSGLSFSQQANGLGTRKRTRGQLTREESLDVGGIS